MHALSLAEYATAGAIAGGTFTALGAAVCHPVAPDSFHVRAAAVAGFVGGATTHGALGLLAAFERQPAVTQRLQRVGASLPLAALTSGLLGGAILAATGHHSHPGPSAMILSGIVGGAIIGAVAATATCVAMVCCLPSPRWTAIASGDWGHRQDLAEGAGESGAREAEPSTRQDAHSQRGHVHPSLAERLLPFEHPDAPHLG